MNHPVTQDGRYVVVRGRLWRMSDPRLPMQERASLTRALMEARRALKGDSPHDQRAAARARIDAAKRALRERGPVWWSDGATDLNRKLVRNTPYAEWFRKLATDIP